MNQIVNLLLLSFIGSVAGLIGGAILLLKGKWAKSLTHVAVPLAAGVLLAVSLLDLLPEAAEEIGDKAFTIVLIAFVAFFLVERFIFSLHHHDGEKAGSNLRDAIPLVIFGDTIHNFLDGVAIAAGFIVSPSLGLVVALSTFLHETPHEIADFGILLSAGWKRQKVFIANLLSSLATFPGAILTYSYALQVESSVGIFLSVAAGLFLYVAATDFLPEVSHAPVGSSRRQALFLIIGILVIVALRIIIPEMH